MAWPSQAPGLNREFELSKVAGLHEKECLRALGVEVQMVSTDGRKVDIGEGVLARGQEVVYRQSDGTRRGATVTAVHHDGVPYYTVRLSDGSEKQTIRDRLELPPRDTGLADQVRCPITLEVMKDPVLASDGHTYERAAIEDWLRTHDTSPMTNARLGSKELMPSLVLRSIISGL